MRPIVHLELHTTDLLRACDFYAAACGWSPEHVRTGAGDYLAWQTGAPIGSGVVQCGTPRSLWLPYVEVTDVAAATERARALGATVMHEPHEGPAGWRSCVSDPAAGEIAFWQQKR